MGSYTYLKGVSACGKLNWIQLKNFISTFQRVFQLHQQQTPLDWVSNQLRPLIFFPALNNAQKKEMDSHNNILFNRNHIELDTRFNFLCFVEEAEYNHICVFVAIHMENSILGFIIRNKKSVMLKKRMCVCIFCVCLYVCVYMGAKYGMVDGSFDYFCIFAHLSGMNQNSVENWLMNHFSYDQSDALRYETEKIPILWD